MKVQKSCSKDFWTKKLLVKCWLNWHLSNEDLMDFVLDSFGKEFGNYFDVRRTLKQEIWKLNWRKIKTQPIQTLPKLISFALTGGSLFKTV